MKPHGHNTGEKYGIKAAGWVVWFFLIASGRSSVRTFLLFHHHLPVCTVDPAANLTFQ